MFFLKSYPSNPFSNKKDDFQVFVSGIPYECSEQEFKDFFVDLAEHIR